MWICSWHTDGCLVNGTPTADGGLFPHLKSHASRDVFSVALGQGVLFLTSGIILKWICVSKVINAIVFFCSYIGV